MNTLAADVRPAKIAHDQTNASVTTTRRGLLCTVTAAAIVGIPMPASAAAPAAASPALLDLIAAHAASEAQIDRFYDQVFNPAVEQQEERLKAVPHIVRQITSMPGDDRDRVWTTAERLDVACAAGIVKLSRTPAILSQEPAAIQRRREARSFWAAHLRRQRAIQRIHDDPAVEAALAEERRLTADQTAREEAIAAFPVRSLADLAVKLEFISVGELEPPVDLLSLLARDVARLMSAEC